MRIKSAFLALIGTLIVATLPACALATATRDRAVGFVAEADDLAVVLWSGDRQVATVEIPDVCLTALGIVIDDHVSLTSTLDGLSAGLLCQDALRTLNAEGKLVVMADTPGA